MDNYKVGEIENGIENTCNVKVFNPTSEAYEKNSKLSEKTMEIVRESALKCKFDKVLNNSEINVTGKVCHNALFQL